MTPPRVWPRWPARAHPSVDRSNEASLLRIVIFTPEQEFAQSVLRCLSVLAPALEPLVLCPRVASRGTEFSVMRLASRDVGVAAMSGGEGDVLDRARSADRLREWGAELAVSVGDVVIPDELRRASAATMWVVRTGWAGGPGGIAEATSIIARATAEPATGATTAIASAQAPVYFDDSLADIECRGAELCVALLRETLGRLVDGRSPDSPTTVELREWPHGLARARASMHREARRIARRVADPQWILKSFAALIVLGIVAPIRGAWRTIRRRHAIHVFTFHRVSELCRDGMTVSPRAFRRQVAAIARTHRIVSIDEAGTLFLSGARLARPVAAITFDDAYRSVVDEAAPVMAASGIAGTVFVSTGVVGRGARFAHDASSAVRAYLPPMEWRDLTALRSAGWSIGAHTITHPRLSRCDGPTLERELAEPIEVINARFGATAVPFAYPFGGMEDITAFARRLVAVLGYSVCLSDFGGENIAPGDPYRMRRIELGGDHASLAWRVRVGGLDLQSWKPGWLRPARGRGVAHAA